MFLGCGHSFKTNTPDRPAPLSPLDALQMSPFGATGHRAGLGWTFGSVTGPLPKDPRGKDVFLLRAVI